MVKTYWNGEEAPARKVVVRLPNEYSGPFRMPWFKSILGTLRCAVQVNYHGTVYLLDDDVFDGETLDVDAYKNGEIKMAHEHVDAGQAWRKVTEGKGSPWWPHRSLPSDCLVLP